MSDDVDEAPVAQAEAKEPTTAEANATADSDSKPAAGGDAQAPIVLEEEVDPNYVPTEDEILEYAKWLGMDPEEDKDLFYIAKEGLKAPLPKDWKPCKDTAPSSLARGLPPRRSPPQYQRDAVSALNPSYSAWLGGHQPRPRNFSRPLGYSAYTP